MAEVTSIKTRELTEEQGVIKAGSSVLNPWRQSVVDGLTPVRLGQIMRAVDQGDPEAYLVLAEEMAEREPHYASVLATRSLGVSGADRSIASASDDPDDVAIAEDIEQLVQQPEFEGLLVDLMDGVAKGFSCIEIMWDRSLKQYTPLEYRFREQRYFTFDRDTYSIPMLRVDDELTDGVPLAPFKWLVHRPKIKAGVPIRAGLARTVAVPYCAKRYTVADWQVFLDAYGMPLKIGRYPANMKERATELYNQLRKLGTDSCAVIPDGMAVEILEAKATGAGTSLFRESAEYWDKQTSKVVLGQTMTTDDGASLSQSKTHERVRFDIRAADARAVIATINRHLIRPYVDLNYGPRDLYPSLVIATDEPEDTASLIESVRKFVAMGGKVQMSEIRDRMGIAEPEDDAELLMPESAVAAASAPPPPEPGAVEGGDADDEDGAADPDDEIEGDGQADASLNRNGKRGAAFAMDGTEDVADDIAQAKLTDWQPLVEGNVGRILTELAAAKSFDEARKLLTELAADEGEVIDLGALVVSLARSTYLARGVGDATDNTEV
jgi:phage gp29-like protein